MERANIKLPREAYERHNDRRQDLGLTWAEYIDGQAPDAPDVDVDLENVTLDAAEVDRIADEVTRRLR